MKFRKKPVVIEAMQLTRNMVEVVMGFIGKEKIGTHNLGEFQEDSCFIEIITLEGIMTAEEGDWIIRGVKGEFYPIKDEIFRETYEKVED